MNYIDLFSGIGGFHIGLEMAGFEFEWMAFSEIENYPKKVYKKHFPNAEFIGDITKIDGTKYTGEIDIITGGFPCQDISFAGKGAGIHGSRSGLWKEMFRIICEIRPQYVIVENVPALLARGLGVVFGDLASCGYDAEWDCIPASAVGAPHRRDRVWIVAYPSKIRCDTRGTTKSLQGIRPYGETLEDVAYSERIHAQRHNKGQKQREPWGSDWWAVEPNVGRVAHGVSSELDSIAWRLGYEDSNSKEAIAAIDKFRKQILRKMWEENKTSKASLCDECRICNGFMPNMSHEFTCEKQYLGERIKANGNLHHLWDEILAKGFTSSQNLLSELLIRIREKECNEKMASNRKDRLKCLGNAVVPQVVAWIGQRLLEADSQLCASKS